MDAVEFVKVIGRLCKAQEDCRYCPLQGTACDASSNTIMECDDLERVQKTVKICEQWAKDHPVKTRQSEFLKLFPNAVIDEDDGILGIRPCDIDESIGCTNEKGCDGCRRKYWLAEVTDND